MDTTYKIGKATVRIHPGERTEEERREAIEKAAQKLLKAAMMKKKAGDAADGNPN